MGPKETGAPANTQFALVQKGGTLSVWRSAGGEFTKLASITTNGSRFGSWKAALGAASA
jgi:hypothetical protein